MNLFETLPLAATTLVFQRFKFRSNKTTKFDSQVDSSHSWQRERSTRLAVGSLMSAFLLIASAQAVYSQEGESETTVSEESSSAVGGSTDNSDAVSARTITASSSRGVAITVYNQNFGLVRDTRTIKLEGGVNYLRFEDVAAAIDPTTVSFLCTTAPNSVVVREQNYQYDVMSPQSILARSVGKTISFKQYLDGGSVK